MLPANPLHQAFVNFPNETQIKWQRFKPMQIKLDATQPAKPGRTKSGQERGPMRDVPIPDWKETRLDGAQQ